MLPKETEHTSVPPFLQGGGEMGNLIRSIDWSTTALGEPNIWPAALKYSVSMMLATNFPVLICWGNDYIQLYNDAFRPILGEGKHPQAMGLSSSKTFNEIWHTIKPLFEQVMLGETVSQPDFMVPLNRNGYLEDCYFDFSYSPIRDEAGKVLGVLVICMETTAKVRAMNQAKLNHENISNMIRQSPVAMGLFSGENMVLEIINDKFLELWGKDSSVIGKPVEEALPEMKGQPYPQIMRDVFNTGVTYVGKEAKVFLHRGGKSDEGYYNFINQPFKDGDGKITGLIVVANEVTEQVKARNEIARMLAQVRLSKEAAELGLFDSNLETGTLEWDARCRTLFGISHQNPVTYDDFINGLHPHDRIRIQKAVDDAYIKELTNGAYDVEYRTVGAEDKKTRWVRAKGQVYFDENDSPVRFIGSVLDITDKKYSEEAVRRVNDDLAWANKELIEAQVQLKEIIDELKASEAKYRDLVQHAPVGIAVYRGREVIVESVNDGMLTIWGKPASVTGLPLKEALPELESEDQPFLKLIDHVYTSGESYFGFEARALLDHNGELKEGYFDFIFQPLKDEDGVTHSVLQVAIDVTQRVVSRLEKFRAEEMLRFSVEAANAATWYMDAETREFVVSDRLREIYGLDPEAEVTYDDILNQIPQEYHERVNIGVHEALAEGKGYSLEHPLVSENGKKRWVRALGKMYPAVGSRRAHFSGLTIDITEQKQDELRKNDFIGMVSHELKTPLTSLTAIIQLLDIKLKNYPDPFVAGAAANANKQAKRMTSMINGFLSLSRLESGKLYILKEKFDIEDLIQEVIEETELIIASHDIHFSPDKPIMVNADRDKIGSVISNLLSNAVKYSPKGKNIEVRCAITGENVQVIVKDEGMGIKPQDKERLFERYYRVQSNHTQHISGFGIGLYLCAEIIQRHEGTIWAESESGVGSTFYFTIPRVL